MNFKHTNKSVSLIEDYYNHFNEDGRLETRHGKVEFSTAIKYISDALKNDLNKTILDIGAGTGKYSCYFDSLGYKVTAVELVPHNIEIFKNKNSKVEIHQGNALDLSIFKDESFDITLIFGPMYHLHTNEEKVRVLNEAKRVTKKGGKIFVSYYMNEFAVIEYAFVKRHILDAIEEGRLDKNFHVITSNEDLYSMVRIEDIDELNKKAGLSRIKIVSQDGASDYIRTAITRLNDEEFSKYIEYHLSICERSDLLGASSHVLDILEKRS